MCPAGLFQRWIPTVLCQEAFEALPPHQQRLGTCALSGVRGCLPDQGFDTILLRTSVNLPRIPMVIPN